RSSNPTTTSSPTNTCADPERKQAMEIRLDGRTALITGGSKGLGLAMAQKFASSGANIAIVARGALELTAAERSVGTVASGQARIMAFRCDVEQASEIETTWRAVIAEFGKVDILVNNAGTSQTGKFEDITDAVWQADLDLKLFGAI